MEIRPEPLSIEEILARLFLVTLLIVGLAGIPLLLSRGAGRDRIRASALRTLLVWWAVPAILWSVGLWGGDLTSGWIDRIGPALGFIVVGLYLVSLLLSPYAALIATAIWVLGRVRARRPG